MKCRNVERYCWEYAGEEMPADVLDHLMSCASCRKVHGQATTVCQFVALKRYEQPDPGFEERNLVAVRAGLEAVQAGRGSWWSWLVEAFDFAPAWRYSMAAAVLAMGFIYVASLPPNTTLSPVAMLEDYESFQPVTLATSTAQPVLAHANQLGIASNQSLRGVQYGPGKSRLVGFEY